LPAGIPLIVAVVVLPIVVNVLGVLVTVHDPDGKLLRITLPVATVQVGCVIAPTSGFNGVAGCALITTLPDDNDVQPPLVTV
jgi:hypothetical protein